MTIQVSQVQQTCITFNNITDIGADYQSAAGAITDTYYRLNYTISGTSPSFSIHATIGIE